MNIMDIIPVTSSLLEQYLITHVKNIVCDYLMYDLHTQQEYITHGVHEAIQYPDNMVRHMVNVFDDEMVFNYVVKYRAYKKTYVHSILHNNLCLAERIATAFYTKYKKQLCIEAFLKSNECDKLEFYTMSLYPHKKCVINSDTMDYIGDLFNYDNKIIYDMMYNILFDGHISCDNFMKSKYYTFFDNYPNKMRGYCTQLYLYKYEYLLYRHIHGDEIEDYVSEIYGFTEKKGYHAFSADILEYDGKNINYRNIYDKIDFQTLINATKNYTYDEVKYILDCTDIFVGYDHNTVYNMSYNVYKHLVKTFDDIQYNPEMMYMLSLSENDIAGMEYVFPKIDKTKLDVDYMKNFYIDDIDVAWKRYILDMGKNPPDTKDGESKFYEKLIRIAMCNNIAHILVAIISVGYKTKNNYWGVFQGNCIDSFLLAYNNGILNKKNYFGKPDHDDYTDEAEEGKEENKDKNEREYNVIRHIICEGRYIDHSITKWLLLNTNHKYDSYYIYVNGGELRRNIAVAISYSMPIKDFLVRYSKQISLQVFSDLCDEYNLDPSVAIKWMM